MAISWTAKRTQEVHSIGWLWPFLAGIPLGLLFLLSAQFETKWFLLLFISSLGLVVLLTLPNKKSYYLALLVMTIPIAVDLNVYFHPSAFYRSTYGFLIHLSHIPLAMLYFLWLSRCLVQRLPLKISTSALLPLTGVLLSGLISMFFARAPLFAAFDLFTLSMSLLLFIYAASEIRTSQEIRLAVWALMASMTLQGAIALGQYLTGSTLGLEFFGASRKFTEAPGAEALTRVGGTLGHPNNLALFFDLLLPLAVSLLFCSLSKHSKLFLSIAIGLGAAGLAVALSRGGIAVVGLATAIILLVRWRERLGLFRSGLALATAGIFFALMLLGTANPLQKRFLRDDYGSAYGRVPHVQVARNIIRSHPLFGVGLNHYTEAAHQYDNTPEWIISSWESPVHNLFLFIAGEIGLVGLGCFLFFLVSVGRATLPALRSADPFVANAGLGLLLGLLAYLAHSQVDYAHWTSFGPFWLLLGLSVSLGRLASSVPPASPTRSL